MVAAVLYKQTHFCKKPKTEGPEGGDVCGRAFAWPAQSSQSNTEPAHPRKHRTKQTNTHISMFSCYRTHSEKIAVFKGNKALKEKSDLLQLENPLPDTLGTNSIKNFRLCLKSGTLAST